MTQSFQASRDAGEATAKNIVAVARCITRASVALRLDTRRVFTELREGFADPDFFELLLAAILSSLVDSALSNLADGDDAMRRVRRQVIHVLQQVDANSDQVTTFAARVNAVTGQVVDAQ